MYPPYVTVIMGPVTFLHGWVALLPRKKDTTSSINHNSQITYELIFNNYGHSKNKPNKIKEMDAMFTPK